MRRRQFLTYTAGSLLGAGLVPAAARGASEWTGYTSVDRKLFQTINRVQNPADKDLLEKKHVPVIEAPQQIRAGEPFSVAIRIGEVLHPMGQNHYIQHIELFAGNEPAGRYDLSYRFGSPEVTVTLALDKPVTLVVREYCNLHGLWESTHPLTMA